MSFVVVLVRFNNRRTFVYSHRVLERYVGHDVVKSCECRFTIALPPHKLVKVAGKLVCVATFHSLQLGLHSVPVALNILGVHSSWSYKFH